MSKHIITIEAEGQHRAWVNELNETKEELKRFESILADISSPDNKKEIEHFQNQFLIQQNAIDKIKNEIKMHDLAIERDGDLPFDTLKKKALEYHNAISEKIEIENKIIKDLKKEFTTFIDAQ